MNVHDLFKSEHRAIRDRIEKLQLLFEKTPEQLEAAYGDFHHQVRLHLRSEDEVYYPFVDSGKQLPDRTLMHDLRNDHAAVVFTLESLAIRLRRKVPLPEWKVKFDGMIKVLLTHFDHEERTLFPEAERRLSSTDLQALLAQVKELS